MSHLHIHTAWFTAIVGKETQSSYNIATHFTHYSISTPIGQIIYLWHTPLLTLQLHVKTSISVRSTFSALTTVV